jgi:predicted nucleotidyltransferase
LSIQTEKEKLARIAANLNRENRLEAQRIKEKIRAAHQEVRRLVAQFLEIDPAIETIVLFGSLAEDSVFSIDFDIDLAVRSEEYLQLVGCGLKSSFRVDVVDLDRVADPIKSSIDKYGKILYEKNKK